MPQRCMVQLRFSISADCEVMIVALLLSYASVFCVRRKCAETRAEADVAFKELKELVLLVFASYS